jgi:hypothetical protein
MTDTNRTSPVVLLLIACALIAAAAVQTPAVFAQTSIWVDHGLPDAVREGNEDLETFFPGATYDPAIPSPGSVLGFPMGARPVLHQEVLTYFEALADASPRVQLIPYGISHEGRTLIVAVVTSEANMARLEVIRENLKQLADPNVKTPPSIHDLPVCIWAGCCIHGDETSGTDAALEVAYHLAACRDPQVAELREDLLILLDPLQNPDGRDRVLAQWRSLAGVTPDADDQSLRHRGLWPGGRTNHYLFDLNRDWFLLSQVETQARVRFITSWNPQLIIDAHEMSSQATYLFSPPREPFNPNITEFNHRWWRRFSSDQAAAFDRHGWEYYTQEWNEEWFPGYGSAWGAGIGAVGILYEQGGVEGTHVARVDGTVMTYRETVHHQVTSFMSNFETASRNREDLLREFREEREREYADARGVFVIVPQAQSAREDFLLRALRASGIEFYRNTQDVQMSGLRTFWTDESSKKVTIPKGSLFVPAQQSFSELAETMFEFDPEMDEEFLRSERRRLEKEGRSRIYEVTAWSVSQSCGLPVYHSSSAPWKHFERVDDNPEHKGCLLNPEATFGFLIDGTDDRALRALIELWDGGVKVHAARKPFTMAGRNFARGTLLVKRVLQNRLEPEVPDRAGDALAGFLGEIAQETGTVIIGVNTALSDEGPDLGSRQFMQLERPKVAVLAGERISTSSYGGIAWLLDHEMNVPFAALQTASVGRFDLDRYNVLVLPDAWDGPDIYRHSLDANGMRRIRAWVRDGGTLIAVGNGAAFIADSTSALGGVRLRRQVLGDLAKKTGRRLITVEGEAESRSTIEFRGDIAEQDFETDELRWAKAPGPMDGLLEGGLSTLRRPEPFWKWAVGKSSESLEEEDARMRLYQPRGTLLKVDLDEEHWLAGGCGVFATPAVARCEGKDSTVGTLPLCEEGFGSWMPVQLHSEYAFVDPNAAHVVGAFASEDSLRLGGLLWPEARERWARTAYLTRERIGEGQVILFVSPPCRRAQFKAAERAFLNAVLLGPGMGTSREWPW